MIAPQYNRILHYSTIGGKTRLSDLQKMLSGVSEEYDELKNKVANSSGALEEMANIMNDNIYGDVKALQSTVESVQLDFMDKFQPSARKFLQWSKDLTLSFGQKLTKAAEKFQYRIEKIESTVKEFKGSKEWKTADLSGKMSIAWDKIIAEPFAEWWSGKGKEWACGVANNIIFFQKFLCSYPIQISLFFLKTKILSYTKKVRKDFCK